jgi:hypothetical protein
VAPIFEVSIDRVAIDIVADLEGCLYLQMIVVVLNPIDYRHGIVIFEEIPL